MTSDDYLLGEIAGPTSASRLHRYEALSRRDGMFSHTIAMAAGEPDDANIASVRDLAISRFHLCWDSTSKVYN